MRSQQRDNISEMKEHEYIIITHDCTTEGEECYACNLGEDVAASEHGLWSNYDDRNNRNPGLVGLYAQERDAEVRGCYMRYRVCA